MQNGGMPSSVKSAQAAPARAAKKSAPRGRSLAKLSGAPGEPLWRQLVQSLRSDIVRGVFRVGSQLPTEEELCKRFSA